MGLSIVLLILSAFLASSVEMVEALTIVLAAGLSRGWRSALAGVAVALVALAAIVAILGPALTAVPLGVLRLVVGGLLLVFGLQWLRKAILRASGYKALHDEDAIFARQLEQSASAGQAAGGIDPYGFTLAFKGVLLEGLEVVFIVLTFGTTQGHHVGYAAIGAGAAVVLVTVAGVAVHAPLSRVPENTMKLAVGIMLTSFGSFWSVEGAGARWPGSDAAIIGLVVLIGAASAAMVSVLRRQHAVQQHARVGVAAG